MITNHATHFIVHSFGRTGSILLTRNLCKSVGSAEHPIPNRHITTPDEYDQIVNAQLPHDVIHTHVMANQPTNHYTRVFNIRLNAVEVILSFICAQHYNTYHKQPINPTPFVCNYTKQQLINSCQDFVKWHNFYSPTITANDCVVVYEEMMSNLLLEHNGRVFENKQTLILNFDDIQSTIKSQEDMLMDSLQPFIAHQNPWDIYQYIRHSIRFNE